jgi:hypothetical protein
MARELMSLGPDRGSGFPVLPLLVVLLPLIAGYGSYKFVQVRSLRPLVSEVAGMQKAATSSQADQDKMAKEVDRLRRQVGALQAIAKVEIVWGGASDSPKGSKLPEARDTKIDFAYTRAGSFWVHPRDGQATVWYYTDEGDTLARIAAQPRVLGAYYLWPILATENGLKMSATDALPAGSLVRVPLKVNEAQIRRAITEAGAPDKARDDIFAQAGLKP